MASKIDLKARILSLILLLAFFLGPAAAQNGITRTVDTKIDDSVARVGVGCVLSRVTLDFDTDIAAKGYSDRQSYDDQITSAFFCGVAGAAITRNPLVSVVSGLTCSAMNVDIRPELRKGDRIVERVHACAAGGAGGATVYDVRTAIGNRDGKKVVLYTLAISTDTTRVKTLVEEELGRYSK